MQNFIYTARDGSGAAVNGVIVAESIAEASKLLRGEGKYPTSVRAASDEPPASPNTPETVAAPAIGKGGVKITRQEVIQFSTQLAIMIETGVPLSEALDCIATQADKPHVKKLVQDVAHSVQGGSDFSTALSRHPRSF